MNSTDKQEIFLSVINRHKGIIYKIVNAYCNDPEDRKDLFQEITIQLWKSFDNYNPDFRHSTWIYRIALNTAISFFRKERSRSAIAHPIADGSFEQTAADPSVSPEHDLNLLHRCITELKELEKAIMILYLEERTYKEIAEIVGITETNVATKIGRIKTILKQKITSAKNQ